MGAFSFAMYDNMHVVMMEEERVAAPVFLIMIEE